MADAAETLVDEARRRLLDLGNQLYETEDRYERNQLAFALGMWVDKFEVRVRAAGVVAQEAE